MDILITLAVIYGNPEAFPAFTPFTILSALATRIADSVRYLFLLSIFNVQQTFIVTLPYFFLFHKPSSQNSPLLMFWFSPITCLAALNKSCLCCCGTLAKLLVSAPLFAMLTYFLVSFLIIWKTFSATLTVLIFQIVSKTKRICLLHCFMNICD